PAELTVKIRRFYLDSDAVYWSPRILGDLRADREQVSAKTVAAQTPVCRRNGGVVAVNGQRYFPVGGHLISLLADT
ncbi:MAG: hypothetical protein ACRDRL_11495, partial [Sciscionella sp.]